MKRKKEIYPWILDPESGSSKDIHRKQSIVSQSVFPLDSLTQSFCQKLCLVDHFMHFVCSAIKAIIF